MSHRKILFVISSFSVSNTGQGGHYYSLKTITSALERAGDDVSVLSFGDFAPPALQDLKINYKHIDVASWSANLPEWCSAATHVHAFDRRSFYFARKIGRWNGAKVYLTKPGGPNTSYFPFSEDIILFSEENLNFMRSDPNLKGARMHLVPNRVASAVVSTERVADFDRTHPFEGTTVLRIARIGQSYRRSILQTVKLAAHLRDRGARARAVLIGTPQDQEVLSEVRSSLGEHDLLLTDTAYTKNASELLPLADIVVGTGRGVMEAAILGMPVLCPVANHDALQLLGRDTVADLQQANFSERATVKSPQDVHALDVSLSAEGLARASGESLEIAKARFDVDAAVPVYHAIYDLPQTGREPVRDKVYLAGGYAYARLKPLLAGLMARARGRRT